MLRRLPSFIAIAVALALFAPIVSAAPGPAITDPAKGGVDFKVQGEYAGDDVDGHKWGAQVIALGEGKFKVVGYKGGLPGDGWSRGDEKLEADGELDDDGVLVFKPIDGADTHIKDGVLEVILDGNVVASLKKVERKSPTLGAKPPKGALVLFAGDSVDAWENGQLVDGKYLGATNCETVKKFGDHKLHIEFRTPFMVAARGQGRGNSGVYVQSRYEVQVLDSFGLDGADNECGGIYKVSKPIVNACLPPLSWQTYDMEFTAAKYDDSGKKTENARVTVIHNGIVIHKDLELPKNTPGRHAEGPNDDAIFLQNHGNPVVYRNIWVVE